MLVDRILKYHAHSWEEKRTHDYNHQYEAISKNLFPKKSGVDEYKIEFGKLLRLGLLQTTIICGSVVILLCSLLSLGCLRRKSNYGK